MAPFIVQNKKIPWTCQFQLTMAHLPQTKFFFRKVINMIFMHVLAPFNVQNFKKSLEWIQSFEDAL